MDVKIVGLLRKVKLKHEADNDTGICANGASF
jgi:hypothetical protein